MDGTVDSISAFLQDVEAFLVPNRIEDGVTLSMTSEAVDYEEEGSGGVIVLKDTLRRRKGLEFTINLGRWSFQIEALMQGQSPDAVKADQTASIDAAADATAITGLEITNALETEKFAALMIMPANKSDGKTLYYLVPKVAISHADREQTLNHTQQTPALVFKALGLETSDPDEVTPCQALYSGVSDDGLYYFFEGAPDEA